MKHPLAKLFTPISMIIFLATASVAIGLQQNVRNAEMIVAADFSGADEVTLVAANQADNESP